MTCNSRLTFGKYKGKRICDCPVQYLQWMDKNLIDTNLSDYAKIANEILADVDKSSADNTSAEEFLRIHGINPNKYK